MSDTLFKKVMRLFEKTFVRINGWEHIPGSKINILRTDVKKYKGKGLVLKDGTKINRGDMVVEIHIDNINADNMDNSLKTIFEWLTMDLNQLADCCFDSNNLKYSKIKGIYCTTIFYRILAKKGFENFELKKTIFNRYIAFWENMLRDVFSRNKNNRIKQKRFPRKCWISIDRLNELK